MLHKPKCENNDITTIRASLETHNSWKKLFHKNPLYFRVNADFEADKEIDNNENRNKTANIYKQNPVLKCYQMESELEDVLKSGNYNSPLGYDNVDWFVDEVMKLEKIMAFYFKKTQKDIFKTEEDDEYIKSNDLCRFCDKDILSDKIRDHCNLTGKNRGPAHSKCNFNVTQDRSNFIPYTLQNFSNYDCHKFFKNWLIGRMLK